MLTQLRRSLWWTPASWFDDPDRIRSWAAASAAFLEGDANPEVVQALAALRAIVQADGDGVSVALGRLRAMLGDVRSIEPEVRAAELPVIASLPSPPTASPREPAGREKAKGRPAPVPEPEVQPGLLGLDASVEDDILERVEAFGPGTLHDLIATRPVGAEHYTPVHGAGRAPADLAPGTMLAVGGRVRCRVTVLSSAGATGRLLLVGAGPQWVRWHGAFSAAERVRLSADGGHPKVVVIARVEADGSLTGVGLANAVHGTAWRLRWSHDPLADAAFDEAFSRLAGLLPEITDWLAAEVLERAGVVGLSSAALALLDRGDHASEGRARMAFDELVFADIGQSAERFGQPADRRAMDAMPMRGLADHLRATGQTFADASWAAIEDIRRELMGLTRPRREGECRAMRRVLFGAAGTPVEDVALALTIQIALAKGQILVVCPERQAAIMRGTAWSRALRDRGVSVAVAPEELRRAEREALRKGELSVVIGTAALLDPTLETRRHTVVLAWEQASYGGLLAAALAARGARADVLVVSRTLVPTARWSDAWRGCDLSLMPASSDAPAKGTVWVEDQREAAYQAVGAAVAAGSSAVIAFPITKEGADLLDLREVANLIATVSGAFFPGASIGFVHGQQAEDDRVRAIADFVARRTQVLICTTMLEITAVMPRPVHVLLEHADRTDVQRLLLWRAWCGVGGHVHYVVGATPRAWGLAAVQALAAGQAEQAVLAVAPQCAVVAPGVTVGPVLPLPWHDPLLDLGLALQARRVAHDALRLDPLLRLPQSARLAALAWHRWAAVVEGDANPVPFAKSSLRKKRRRRRKGRPGAPAGNDQPAPG